MMFSVSYNRARSVFVGGHREDDETYLQGLREVYEERSAILYAAPLYARQSGHRQVSKGTSRCKRNFPGVTHLVLDAE
jgi:hypothetical protein